LLPWRPSIIFPNSKILALKKRKEIALRKKYMAVPFQISGEIRDGTKAFVLIAPVRILTTSLPRTLAPTTSMVKRLTTS
jgi:hypothetical protein